MHIDTTYISWGQLLLQSKTKHRNPPAWLQTKSIPKYVTSVGDETGTMKPVRNLDGPADSLSPYPHASCEFGRLDQLKRAKRAIFSTLNKTSPLDDDISVKY